MTEVNKRNVKPLNSLNILHQNVRGLRNRSDESIHSIEIV
jgi:hypothetical protein